MFKIAINSLIFAFLFLPISTTQANEPIKLVRTCTILNFYEEITPERGVKAITKFGNLEELETILVPTTLKEGTYEVKLSRKTNNLYKIQGEKIYLETSFCSYFPGYDGVIVRIKSNNAYVRGEIYFD